MTKYFKFDGLATRSEYWAVYLINLAVFFVLLFTGVVFFGIGESMDSVVPMLIGGLILVVSLVGPTWIAIATTVRRCKDADINPWWTLSTLIPYINIIPWIVIGVLPTIDKTRKNDTVSSTY
jgi:uncharacterized membrane protein YhaH (DUF805 family)